MPLKKYARKRGNTEPSQILKVSCVFSKQEAARLRAFGKLKGWSFSAIVRDAVDEYLAKYVEPIFPTDQARRVV